MREPLESRFWKKVVKSDGCWSWNGATTDFGYGVLGRGPRGSGNIRATHVSWTIHHGPIPSGMLVLHKCDNPPCCNPDHLFLGTYRDNVHDCIKKGRSRFFGDFDRKLHPRVKLSTEDILKIRERAATGIPTRRKGRIKFWTELASEFGIKPKYAQQVASNNERKAAIK